MESKTFLLFSTFFPPYHIGGDATHVENLAKMLVEDGNEVHVVHLLDSYYFKKGRSEIRSTTEKEDGVFRHPLSSPYGITSLFRAYTLGGSKFITDRCQELIERIDPDIIHHHNIAGFGPSILKFKAKEKKLYTAHDYWLVCQSSRLMKFGSRSCTSPHGCSICQMLSRRPVEIWRSTGPFERYIETIDQIIAPSEYMKNELTRFGIKNDMVVIPNFVEPPIGPMIRHEDRKYLLYVGALEKHKGIMELVSYYDRIFDKFGLKLHIVGDGPLLETIYKMISRNGLKDKIEMLGRRTKEDLASEYPNAMALILPSICPENNPMVALEALSFGTPVIGRRNGGIPEIINKINSRSIYDTFEQLISAIEFVINDFNINYNAKNIYEKYYSPYNYIFNYYNVMKK